MMTNSGGMSFDGMAPEDIFAMGIKKGLELVKDLGRNGDSELAHVTPEEQQMLMAKGGAGTTNPATGMPEFFESDMGRERGRDTGVGGGSDAGSAGGGNRSDMERERGRQTGVRGTTQESQRSDMEANRGQTGVGANPSSAGGSAEPSGDAGADDRSFGQRLADGIAAALQGPSFGPPTGKDPGFLGAAASLAPGIGWGMGLTRGLQAMGFESTADFGDPDADQHDDRVLSPGRQQQQGQGQPQAPQYAWQRPGSLPSAPQALGFDAGMTPLQQRAGVATGGTSGNAGIFRDPAIVDFYRNLATYSLTDPSGAPAQGAAPLPIELQYLTQLGGQPGNTTESFLQALAGL